jgi:translation initiation factor IF-1
MPPPCGTITTTFVLTSIALPQENKRSARARIFTKTKRARIRIASGEVFFVRGEDTKAKRRINSRKK